MTCQIGGGTGYNIEAMSAFVSVPEFFSSVYLVDFSPSLCEVARKRFTRLGWKNVNVVCQDARSFRLKDYEKINAAGAAGFVRTPTSNYFDEPASIGGADLITMSYSLSMIVSTPFPLYDSRELSLCIYFLCTRMNCRFQV